MGRSVTTDERRPENDIFIGAGLCASLRALRPGGGGVEWLQGVGEFEGMLHAICAVARFGFCMLNSSLR